MCLGPIDAVSCGAAYGGAILTPDQIAAQIAEAVKAEREACARIASEAADEARQDNLTGWGIADAAACAIRARGETA